jgi:hypothetical protein
MRWFYLRRGTELLPDEFAVPAYLADFVRAPSLVDTEIFEIKQLLSVTRGDAGKLAPFSAFIIEPRLAWERVKSCSSVQACEFE